ncbi:MAG: glutamine-hydrolyzing carbamoyl-phosphate synthase small subunit [Candidatus Pacebacteria bacterium]|nr:glutamine-hydrolyzing carbamoyl-phosphate synthase small subunit [Candidatus Paceibacterota bacterium]MBP9839781.1 glutamine-hydrolyzing carbamoyl-phosphate synthase small subunit [Candidatus Paceibacterota bacterium]
MKSKLILKDGNIYEGENFGASTSMYGEVVFATGMVGYPEALTDPSFRGQILVMTYPIIGSYGVPKKEFLESDKIQVAGLVVSNYIDTPSHHENIKTLSKWFRDEGVPLLEIKDTRGIVEKLRHEGVMLGKIESGKKLKGFQDPNKRNLVDEVSTKKILTFHPSNSSGGNRTIALLDCGAKKNIINRIVARGFTVKVLPWDTDLTKLQFEFSAVVISNGPGDPTKVSKTISNVKKLINKDIPILGICLGNQILTLALGGSTYKLKFGHRSQNQPAVLTGTKRCYLTTQNHGFAVKRIPKGFRVWFHNANDNTNEGIIHESLPLMSVQFHPESSPGPLDTDWVFDYFFKQAGI